MRLGFRVWGFGFGDYVEERLPGSCIDAIRVLFEGGQRLRGVEIPQLYGVIPAACQECVPPNYIPIYTVHLQFYQNVSNNSIASSTLMILLSDLMRFQYHWTNWSDLSPRGLRSACTL